MRQSRLHNFLISWCLPGIEGGCLLQRVTGNNLFDLFRRWWGHLFLATAGQISITLIWRWKHDLTSITLQYLDGLFLIIALRSLFIPLNHLFLSINRVHDLVALFLTCFSSDSNTFCILLLLLMPLWFHCRYFLCLRATFIALVRRALTSATTVWI